MSITFDFSTFPDLTTARLCLRRLDHNDANSLVEMLSSPEVLRFIGNPPTDTYEKAIDLIAFLNELFDKQESIEWAMTSRENGQFVGTCGIHSWDTTNRRVDIGYQLLPSQWGKGYATEACHAVIRWSFEHLDLHRIQADITDGNIASEQVLLKCGFKFEGIWRENTWEHGRFVDIKQFGLLRREYKEG